MLWEAMSSVRDIRRLHDIGAILVRYGFGDMVRRIGLADALERAGRVLHWHDTQAYAHMAPPERVRRALEDLGPTFVKLGQVLATRVDLFELEWITEFGKLHDHAPPSPWEAVQQQLIEDLGASPETVFAGFDPQPLAAASIAQVYIATLEDGTPVVIKVRRPGIRSIVESDLRLLAHATQIAEAQSPELRAFRPHEVVRQFSQSLRRELDLAEECRNAERIAENFVGYTDADTPGSTIAGAVPPSVIVIPRIYWQWTTERVCVQDRIEGIPGTNLLAVRQTGLDTSLLARRGACAVLKMIVDDGLFHADPHPGNVFYLQDNRIAFVDFGMVGHLTEERRDQLLSLLLGVFKNQPRQVADVLLDWTGENVTDEAELVQDIDSFVDRYRRALLKQFHLAAMLSDLVAILRRHHLMLPPDLSLLVKAFITLEGMGRELDPGFDMGQELMPVLERAARARFMPAALLRRGWRAGGDTLALLASLPRDLSRLLRAARRGRLEIHVDVPRLVQVSDRLDRAVSRLTIGIVVAALIVGSSIVMTVSGGPALLGLPVFGLFGFVGAVLGAIWLLVSVRRSGRVSDDGT
ncbi:ABC1 kinase family protein [Paraburkholderia phenazinium]|uniref:2-octaprenylphenol hydroxylase n=1 Tax=Paraburkholderia phenazinium TaxID=60549 RepID=A0A1G8JSS8_9BURK|nr:AarF/UbiB family protein [Paraburkholderia phenazinium]SDI34117.1 2-octaprenylphenol hydroxylase [Paraburkholderia phenazinium]